MSRAQTKDQSGGGRWRHMIELGEIGRVLEAEVLSGETLLDRTIARIAATNMLSRVLADFSDPRTLLITNLISVQAVFTAEVAGLAGIIFLGDVRPGDYVIDKARTLAVPAMFARLSMKDAGLRLDGKGLEVL